MIAREPACQTREASSRSPASSRFGSVRFGLGTWGLGTTGRRGALTPRRYRPLLPALPEREVAAPASELLGVGTEALQEAPAAAVLLGELGAGARSLPPHLGGQSFRVPCQWPLTTPAWAEGHSRVSLALTRERSRAGPE